MKPADDNRPKGAECMNRSVTMTRRQAGVLLAGILVLAAVLRICIAMLFLGKFDTQVYLGWARGVQDGFFNAYDGHIPNMDYPPLYLYPLKLIGMLLAIPGVGDYLPYEMLLIKLTPILCDLMTVAVLYFACRRRSVVFGLILASVWAINPASIFNCAVWGQTDTMMIFLIALCLWALDEDRPILGAVLFAVAGLTKLQCLYFGPIVLFYFLRRKDWTMLLKAVGAGLATVAVVFVPFMIGAKSWTLIFDIYLGGYDLFPVINLNAFNFYGLGELNWVTDTLSIFGGSPNGSGQMVGGFTFSMLSTILLLLSLAFVCFLMLKGKRFSVWMGSLMLMQCLFMLTIRQHERYQIVVLILCLMAFLKERDYRLFGLFCGVCVISFFNQALVFAKAFHPADPWVASFNQIQFVFSFFNVLLFFFTVYLCWEYAFGKPSWLKKTIAAHQQNGKA